LLFELEEVGRRGSSGMVVIAEGPLRERERELEVGLLLLLFPHDVLILLIPTALLFLLMAFADDVALAEMDVDRMSALPFAAAAFAMGEELLMDLES
jgi:hypothetical protein